MMPTSIVIPSYNGQKLLAKHLPSVLAALRSGDEIVIVDDASTDTTQEFLSKEFPHVKYVKNNNNLRFAESCNRGIKAAKHEIVLLLNNDVSPEKNILSKLHDHFSDNSVFAVGCLEINQDGRQSGRSTGMFSKGMLQHQRAHDQNGNTTLWASGGSMAVRRSLWIKLGGMDPLFHPAYKEDLDLSYRAWKAGYVVRFEPSAIVHHHHESTNRSVFTGNEIEKMSYKNEFIFLWKNLTDPDLIAAHIFWLIVYILPILGIRTEGKVLWGFVQAIFNLQKIMVRRRILSPLRVLTDREVIRSIE